MARRKEAPNGYREVVVERLSAGDFRVTLRGKHNGVRFDDRSANCGIQDVSGASLELLSKDVLRRGSDEILAS